MDLQAKLTSLLKEKEEQEQIEQRARERVMSLERLIKATEKLIKEAEKVFAVHNAFHPKDINGNPFVKR